MAEARSGNGDLIWVSSDIRNGGSKVWNGDLMWVSSDIRNGGSKVWQWRLNVGF